MDVRDVRDYGELSRAAAALLLEWVAGLSSPSIVLPTGNTPLGCYAALTADPRAKALTGARLIQLDEYHGIARDDPRNLGEWLMRALLRPLAIPSARLHRFDSSVGDTAAEAARMEEIVEAIGVDVAILGLGPNGHIGFNEPGSNFDSLTRLIELTPESIRSNAAYWGEEGRVPPFAFSLGLGTLARARRTLLLVSGERKADILAETLNGAISPALPATYLRLLSGAVVIADQLALRKWRGGRG